jgi:hypothetical protein
MSKKTNLDNGPVKNFRSKEDIIYTSLLNFLAKSNISGHLLEHVGKIKILTLEMRFDENENCLDIKEATIENKC